MDLKSRIERIVGPKYIIKMQTLEGDVGSWTLNDDLHPVALIDPRMAERSFEVFDDAELYKFYADPFFGLVPHEHDEALVFIDLVRGIKEPLREKYPKSKKYVIASDWKSIGMIENPEQRIRSVIGQDVAEWDAAGIDDDCMLISMQMIAHKIIISENQNAYYNWIKEGEKRGLHDHL